MIYACYLARLGVIMLICLGFGVAGAVMLPDPRQKMVSILLACVVCYLVISLLHALNLLRPARR